MKYFISRRDRIILSAIDIINERGFQGLSTKELAARQEINESALYRHFKNKDDILAGVLDHFSQYDDAIYNSIINKELNSKEKMLMYIKSYVEYYENYPAITAVLVSYESLRHEAVVKEKISEIFRTRLSNFESLILESQNIGEMNSYFSPQELARIIFGYINTSILEWRIEGCNYSFKEKVLAGTDKLLESQIKGV